MFAWIHSNFLRWINKNEILRMTQMPRRCFVFFFFDLLANIKFMLKCFSLNQKVYFSSSFYVDFCWRYESVNKPRKKITAVHHRGILKCLLLVLRRRQTFLQLEFKTIRSSDIWSSMGIRYDLESKHCSFLTKIIKIQSKMTHLFFLFPIIFVRWEFRWEILDRAIFIFVR